MNKVEYTWTTWFQSRLLMQNNYLSNSIIVKLQLWLLELQDTRYHSNNGFPGWTGKTCTFFNECPRLYNSKVLRLLYNKWLFSAALSAMLIPSDGAGLKDCSINPLDCRYITKASSALPSHLFSLSTQHPRSLLFYIMALSCMYPAV